MKTLTVTLERSFECFECPECRINYWLPDGFRDERRKDQRIWWCPNGHQRWYAESEVDRLRRERDVLKQQMARAEEERDRAYRIQSEAVDARIKAERELRRVQRRAVAAVCPCCNRSFQNVARHMKTKHPNVTALTAKK